MSRKINKKPIMAWHWTNGDRLRDGRPIPAIRKWLYHKGPVKMCHSGLHASEKILDSLLYAPGTTLHRVTIRRIVKRDQDKLVARSRRIEWSAEMLWALVEFAEGCAKRASIYAADASTAAYVAAYSASISAAADAADASTAADAADASTAAYAACASASAYAAADAADITKYERGWQESTLLLWAECAAMDGYCERELKKGGA